MLLTSLAVSIAIAWAAPAMGSPAQPDSFRMEVLDSVLYYGIHTFPCGDADRNGRHEFYARRHYGGSGVYALEFNGAGFDTVALGIGTPSLWGYGDADGDGWDELLTNDTGGLTLYEATLKLPYPNRHAWNWDPPPPSGFTGISLVDVDADSARELAIFAPGLYAVCLFECTGDDSYELLAILSHPLVSHFGELVQTYDMDRDGKPELFCGSDGRRAVFFENVCRDSFVCVGDLSFDVARAGAVGATPDMDGDGLPEAIVYGVSYEYISTLAVIEAPADNLFEVVWQEHFPAPLGTSSWHITTGDIDGDSVAEFAVTTGRQLRVYRCSGPDSYEVCWQMDNIYKPVTLYDIDQDGRCELLYGQTWSTVIREYVPGNVDDERPPELHCIRITPSHTSQGPVRIAGIADCAEVEVVDAVGRVVARPRDGIWNLRGVSPGAYFVRVRIGNQAVVQKVLVLR